MNERIFKLWDQANIRYTNDYALSGKPREEWRSIPDMFAELIVRECGRVYIQNQQDGVMTLTQDLLKHFGVKQ